MKGPSIPNGSVAAPGPAPRILAIPVGLAATGTRSGTDWMGAVDFDRIVNPAVMVGTL